MKRLGFSLRSLRLVLTSNDSHILSHQRCQKKAACIGNGIITWKGFRLANQPTCCCSCSLRRMYLWMWKIWYWMAQSLVVAWFRFTRLKSSTSNYHHSIVLSILLQLSLKLIQRKCMSLPLCICVIWKRTRVCRLPHCSYQVQSFGTSKTMHDQRS